MKIQFCKYISIFLFFFFLSSVNAEEYKEGLHYEVLDKPTPTRNANRIEVVELFWFSCSHCYSFEFYINDWKKKLTKDIDFWKSHVTWNATAKIHARIYYIAQALGIEEEVVAAAFNSIHQEKRFLTGETELEYFFNGFGIDKERYKAIKNSFGIENSINQADRRMRRWEISAVPNIIINGKYKVSPNNKLGINQLLDVVDFLVEKEKQHLIKPL